jgi:3-deoxy-manno-octulosonate cytidylyltransferase (CMP-KDO synthetase)
MQFIGIIPARYASSRFPGKPLADIGGKTMIQRVYEQAQKCDLLAEVVVATDDERIFKHAETFGNVVMTDASHRSGTDRCLEAFSIINKKNKYRDEDGLINIQGDEPFVAPGQIEMLIKLLQDPGKDIVSLVKKISSAEAYKNPNVVKVVMSKKGKALYFSRSPIPYLRNDTIMDESLPAFGHQHIGLYGFRIDILKQIAALPEGKLEKAESLEQLRWMENAFDIYLSETLSGTIAIDTPEDLKKITTNL